MFEIIRAFFRKPSPPKIATRDYDGGSGGRRWRGSGQTPSLQQAALRDRETLRRRAQDFAINNGLAASAVSVLVSEAIGSGLRAVPQTGDDGLDKILDAAWNAWTPYSDYFGSTDFYSWQTLACGRQIVDGDCFTMLQAEEETGALRLKPLDPEQMYSALNMELPGGGLIVAGVQVDKGGKPEAYHVYKRWIPSLPLLTGLEVYQVPAEDMVHIFQPQAAGQVRGVSALSPVLLRLREYDSLIDAQLVRQKIGALLCGFVTDADGTLLADGAAPGEQPSLEPGTLQRLRPGETVSFSNPPTTDAGADAFQKTIIREIAAGLGLPCFLLDGNMGEVNFSSARVALISFRRRLEQWQGLFIHQALRPIYRRWLTLEILSGRIDADLSEATLNHKWIAPRSVWVDPLKDAQATGIALSNGLTSRREAVASLGLSIEELDQEIAQDRAREKRLGLAFPQAAPPPAADPLPAEEADNVPAS